MSAEQEIVLAAGAINSPKLLMLSGIGPADHLSSHGIDVRSSIFRASDRTCTITSTSS